MQPQQQHRARHFLGTVLSLVFVGFSIWLFLNRQVALDHFIVYKFPPSSQVVAAADRSGLNDNGKFLLYSSVPKIQNRDDFAKSCSNIGEKTAVLGCYSAQRTYVLDVTEPRLDGIEEVTLTHEMLHAAYERLNTKDRSYVDGLLEEQYKANNDPKLAELLKVYETSEPGERDNELHSILATEVANLSPKLESYYGRYFSSRQKTVALYAKYDSVFEEIKNQQEALVDDLNQRAKSINEQISTYNNDADQLTKDIDTFNKNASGYTSQAAFNRDRQALVARQDRLKQSRETIVVAISAYEAKKKELAEVNIQAAQLNQSINSNIEATPSL